MGISNSEVFKHTVPLLVLEYCPTPQHLSTWIAISWLWTTFRDQRLDDALIARHARVPMEVVPALVEDLIRMGLLRGNRDTGEYTPAWFTLSIESARHASSIVAQWATHFPPPTPGPEQAAFFIFDEDAPEKEDPR